MDQLVYHATNWRLAEALLSPASQAFEKIKIAGEKLNIGRVVERPFFFV
jgi:hypothetical protein